MTGGAQQEGVAAHNRSHSAQLGVEGGGGLWLAQNFKTPLKVILGSHHTHPLSEKGPRSQETENLSSAPLDRQEHIIQVL